MGSGPGAEHRQQHSRRDPGRVIDDPIGGFTSKAACEAGAQALASRAIAVVGQARMQAGIQGNGSKATPVLNYECVFIKK